MDVDLGRLHRIILVVDWGRRTGQVVNGIDLDIERKSDVVAHQFKIRIANQVADITFGSGVKIIDTQHFVTGFEQLLT